MGEQSSAESEGTVLHYCLECATHVLPWYFWGPSGFVINCSECGTGVFSVDA